MIDSKGQSLLEIVIALAIAGMVALGLVKATSISVKNTRFSANQSRLTALAQERIAQIVAWRNSHPNFFAGGLNNYFPDNFRSTMTCVCSPGCFCEEDNLENDYCLRFSITDTSSSLPTQTPGWGSTAKMAHIRAEINWEYKGSGVQCGSKNFNHQLFFETDVTN